MKKPLYVIHGKVIAGEGYGHTLGFPTANLDREQYTFEKMNVLFGVYAGTAHIAEDPKEYPAGIVIGPLDESGLPKIEAHLLDFSEDLYDKVLTLSLHAFLRPYQTFEKESALKKQIEKDIEQIRSEMATE